MEARDDFDFNIDIDEISVNFDVDFSQSLDIEQRVHKPKYHKPFKSKHVKYENAEELTENIGLLETNEKVFCILSGSFIFGDFIEAYIVKNNLNVKRLLVSTLSMSRENVDSLKNLIDGDYVSKLDLLVSSYFWGHERWKLVPYILQELDNPDNKFQLSVSGNHCKIILFETYEGDHYVIHGSSNLRSSNCLEQICMENNKELFDFNMEFFGMISDKFQTIDKEVKHNRGSKLWQQAQQEVKAKGQKSQIA